MGGEHSTGSCRNETLIRRREEDVTLSPKGKVTEYISKYIEYIEIQDESKK